MNGKRSDEHRSHPGAPPPFVGTLCLVSGAAILFLALVDSTGELPLDMPRFWYTNRRLWGLLSFILLGTAFYLLRSSSTSPKWEPSLAGQRFQRLVIYTRENCHLCDEAVETLSEYRSYFPEFEVVDIDSDPNMVEQFGECVPVVEIDGKVRFRGRVNEVLLRRLIEGSAPKDQPFDPN